MRLKKIKQILKDNFDQSQQNLTNDNVDSNLDDSPLDLLNTNNDNTISQTIEESSEVFSTPLLKRYGSRQKRGPLGTSLSEDSLRFGPTDSSKSLLVPDDSPDSKSPDYKSPSKKK